MPFVVTAGESSGAGKGRRDLEPACVPAGVPAVPGGRARGAGCLLCPVTSFL